MAETFFQPALLDRLTDNSRTVTRLKIALDRHSMNLLGVVISDIKAALVARGFHEADTGLQEKSTDDSCDADVLWFEAIGSLVQPSQLKELLLTPAGAVRKIRLRECCLIEGTSGTNLQVTAQDRQGITMSQLRNFVRRDLNLLLNTASLDSVEDLSGFPLIAHSVLNFGMPALTGQRAETIDAAKVAGRIRQAIECYEPRLSRLTVKPEIRPEGESDGSLTFHIEAELWGQPFPEPLALRTHIDFGSGVIQIDEVRRGR